MDMTPGRAAAPPLEFWGGLECIVARIGDSYVDQTRLNGHHDRPQDLEAFAALGVRALRYPPAVGAHRAAWACAGGLALHG